MSESAGRAGAKQAGAAGMGATAKGGAAGQDERTGGETHASGGALGGAGHAGAAASQAGDDSPAGEGGAGGFDGAARGGGGGDALGGGGASPAGGFAALGGAGAGGSNTGWSGRGGGGGQTGSGQETACADGSDEDADGAVDCADSDCTLACSLDCPAGTSFAVYAAEGLPDTIPDWGEGQSLLSAVSVTRAGRLARVAVQVDVTHAFLGDLLLTLEAPGFSRILAERRGASGNHYTGTVFADGGAPLASGSPPFAGVFQPEQSFGSIDAPSLAGEYVLRITDHGPADIGSLRRFWLGTCECLEDCALTAEVCDNAVDDDADGDADCRDESCVGTLACVERPCDDGIDNDGNGAADCEDATCTGTLECAVACPPGTKLEIHGASDLPLALPAANPGAPVASTISLPEAGRISDLAVRTSIGHPRTGELEIALRTPQFRRVLSANNGADGADGADYTRTIFADGGAPIWLGSAPFTGTFEAEQPFHLASGMSAAGDYQLEVVDAEGTASGTITDFALALCACRDGCEFGMDACQNGVDDDRDELTDCDDPDCAGIRCRERDCSDGLDDDGNGAVDCADAACAWACDALAAECGANELHVYQAAGLPLPISGGDSNGWWTPVVVAAHGSVALAAVRFGAAHTFVADLELSLASAMTTNVHLSRRHGGGGDDYAGTVFIDSAPARIGSPGYDVAPFAGSYQPDMPLASFIGERASGVWQATLIDVAPGDGGSFDEFALALCVTP